MHTKPTTVLVGMFVEVEDKRGKRRAYVNGLGLMSARDIVHLNDGTVAYVDDIKRHVIQPHEVTVLPAGVMNPFSAEWDHRGVYGDKRKQALDDFKAGKPDHSLSFWWAEFTGYAVELTDPAQVDWA